MLKNASGDGTRRSLPHVWLPRRVALGLALGAALALVTGLTPGLGPQPRSGYAAADTASADASPADTREKTQAIMGRLLESLKILLPASAGRDGLGDPALRPEIEAAAAELARDAAALRRHAVRIDEGAVFLGSSLARDAKAIHTSLKRGQVERARYLIAHLTEGCMACHARLPSEDSPRAEEFVASEKLAGLPPMSRATLEIATRRFSDAQKTLERILLAPDVSPALLIGPITDYLVVTLRVRKDFESPVSVLTKFAERPDLWRQLRLDVQAWLAAIPELEKRVAGDPSVATARELIAEAGRATQYPGDREGLAHYVVASGILYRVIEARPELQRDLAEAYYLLAVCEINIAQNYWVSPADFLLESAIRLAPDEEFAQDAYALLEQQILQSFEGVDEDLPEDDTRRLDELRGLID